MNAEQINEELGLNIKHQDFSVPELAEFIYSGACERMQIQLLDTPNLKNEK